MHCTFALGYKINRFIKILKLVYSVAAAHLSFSTSRAAGTFLNEVTRNVNFIRRNGVYIYSKTENDYINGKIAPAMCVPFVPVFSSVYRSCFNFLMNVNFDLYTFVVGRGPMSKELSSTTSCEKFLRLVILNE